MILFRISRAGFGMSLSICDALSSDSDNPCGWDRVTCLAARSEVEDTRRAECSEASWLTNSGELCSYTGRRSIGYCLERADPGAMSASPSTHAGWLLLLSASDMWSAGLAAFALLRTARSRMVVLPDPAGITVIRGKRRSVVPWARVHAVVISGARRPCSLTAAEPACPS